jgi:thiosulfate/3-mercaptopyruvate sulfurtransferase
MLTRLPVPGVALGALITAAPALASVPSLVDPAWLADRLDQDDVAILDVRSPIDDGNRVAFSEGHIPGAVDAGYTRHPWRAEQEDVTGQLPPVEQLEGLIEGFGVDNADTVVIVPAGTGATDFGSAARVYWTFKALGHEQVTILNGGYQGWLEAGHGTADGAVSVAPGEFNADLQTDMIVTTADVEQADDRGLQLIDARPAEFFEGDRQHPGARVAGTIPGAINLPHKDFIREEEVWRFDPASVNSAIDADTLAEGRRPVSFCNTGHWATTTWFALSEVRGIDDVGLYDGSMVAWTASESRPVDVAKRGLARILEFFGG